MLFLQTRQLQRRDGGDLFISFLQRTVFAQSCSTDEPWALNRGEGEAQRVEV